MVAISSALSAAFASAAYSSSWGNPSLLGSFRLSGCEVSSFKPDLPPNQTLVLAPTDLTPTNIGLAFGTQNYTCASTNTYTNVGALAELVDVSCIVNASFFPTIQEPLYGFWTEFNVSVIDIIDFFHFTNPPEILAQHYFVPNPAGSGLSPKWDFTSSGRFEGNSNAFMIGKTNGTLPSPNNATEDVTWLEVLRVEGEIASEVIRFDTVGGQPPASCTFGSSPNITVKYTGKYLFYGGNLTNWEKGQDSHEY